MKLTVLHSTDVNFVDGCAIIANLDGLNGNRVEDGRLQLRDGQRPLLKTAPLLNGQRNVARLVQRVDPERKAIK